MSLEDLNSWLAPISEEFPCGEDDGPALSLDNQFEIRWDEILRDLKGIRPIVPGHEQPPAAEIAQPVPGSLGLPLSSEQRKFIKELTTKVHQCFGKQCKSLVLAMRLPQLLMLRFGSPSGFSLGLKIFLELLENYGGESPGRRLLTADGAELRARTRGGYYSGTNDRNHLQLFRRLQLEGAALYKLETDRARFQTAIEKSAPEKIKQLHDSLTETILLSEQADLKFLPWLSEPDHSPGGKDSENPRSLFERSFLGGLKKLADLLEQIAIAANQGYAKTYPSANNPAVATETIQAAAAVPANVVRAGGPIESRREAIELLRKIADYFETTEPHSPIPYALREAAKWADLKLPQLLQTLIGGGAVTLEEFSKRVGLPLPEVEKK